jgi:hypothetical protein
MSGPRKYRSRKAYYHQNKDRILFLQYDRYKKNPVPTLVSAAKKRAKQSGIAFDISSADLTMPLVCPIFGVTLIPNIGGKRHSSCSPTIDRIDPTRGYVRGNVWIISHRANQIKNDATLEELWQVARAVAQRTENRIAA